MKDQPLVSIIIPCYNGASFVWRLLDSIFEQTYSNIEVIFVNDGSEDGTGDIARRYQERSEGRGFRFQYIAQENRGVCGAINAGLSVFHGEYLSIPNSDDWMEPVCIERMAGYLEDHLDKCVVISKGAIVLEKDLKRSGKCLERKNVSSCWIFEDLMLSKDIYFGSAGWMSRSKMFLEVNPQRHIYESRVGQNWQLYLPLLYKYECGFLQEVLWCYLLRTDSLEHRVKDPRGMIARTFQYEDILKHVLDDIGMPEEDRRDYLRQIRSKYTRERLQLAAEFHVPDVAEEEYSNLVQENAASLIDRYHYMRGKYRSVDRISKMVKGPLRAARKMKRMMKA